MLHRMSNCSSFDEECLYFIIECLCFDIKCFCFDIECLCFSIEYLCFDMKCFYLISSSADPEPVPPVWRRPVVCFLPVVNRKAI